MVFTVHFSTVTEQLQAHESVFVTGNVPQLGNWQPHLAQRLEKSADGRWHGAVSVDVETLKFRYFTGYYLESDASKEPTLIVSKWETFLTPRTVMPAVESTNTRVCRATVNDLFGFNGGREVVSDGWLLTPEQHQITLTIQGEAIKFYKAKHQRPTYRLRVVPMDLRHRGEALAAVAADDDEASEDFQPTLPSFSRAQIAAFTSSNPRYRHQDAEGESFVNGEDYYVYRTQTVAVEYLGFRIEVYENESEESREGSDGGSSSGGGTGRRLLAAGYAVPSTLQDSFGRTSVPLLTTSGLPVGKIYIGYLFVRPLADDGGGVPEQNMRVSYSKHWKKRIALEVGHRGMGNSYTKLAAARENTLHSLDSAAKNGADYVEFDVHLTKDKKPIIFHDFHVLVSVARRTASIDDLSVQNGDAKTGAIEAHELAVKELKHAQLQLLHLDHIQHEKRAAEEADSGKLHYRVTGTKDEGEEHRPFPSLENAFSYVSAEAGFNIEIKYPMEWEDGSHECANYFECNDFLDVILTQVLRQAGTRRIVFSSFDPAICSMLMLKQNKYPVLFLCQGQTVKHNNYIDRVTQTSDMAVRFAAGVGLAGVNLHSEDLLRNAEPIALAKKFNIITFVWGDEMAAKEVVSYFKSQKVDGVIYDRIGESEKRSNIFLLEKEKKEALFGTKKPPSPLPRRQSTFASNSDMQRQASSTATSAVSSLVEHLDLSQNATSGAQTHSPAYWPGLLSSANSSTSSGISVDSASVTPLIKRQHNSFTHTHVIDEAPQTREA